MKLAALALAALFCAHPLAQAVPITDWRTDDLLMQAADARKELGLSENQNLLWDQSVRKTRAILRARKDRRELVDAAARKAAIDPAADLRSLAAPLEDDASLSREEDRQLRETWLTLNDALDDRRRAVVLARVRSLLERQAPGPGEGGGRGEGRPERGGGKPEGGGRGQGPGGMSGMSGSGSIGMGMGRGF